MLKKVKRLKMNGLDRITKEITIIKIAILTCILLLLISCNRNEHLIKKVKIVYLPGISESPFSNRCDSAFNNWHHNKYFVDTIITDPVILNLIENEIKSLKVTNTIYPVDARISCTLYYSNDSVSELCMGSLIGTVYNQNQVTDNHELNYLIKKHSGFYYFIPLELVIEMPEISDYPKRLLEIKSEDSNYLKLGDPELIDDSLVEIQIVRELPYLKDQTKH